jgi:enediyne polyketide synthase
VAAGTLNAARDRDLLDHVFEGTPILPAVFAIDAMVMASQACAESTALPVLRTVRFHRPVVVPQGSKLDCRVHVVALGGHFGAALRSKADGYRADAVSATCHFDLPADTPCPLEDPLPEFDPPPSGTELFQGPSFRHITGCSVTRDRCLTKLVIPEPGSEAEHATPYPFFRDALLQSAAPLMPRPMLPVAVDELRIVGAAQVGQEVVCRASVTARDDASLTAELDLFTVEGRWLEAYRGLRFEAPHR